MITESAGRRTRMRIDLSVGAWWALPAGYDPALWWAAVREVARLSGERLEAPEVGAELRRPVGSFRRGRVVESRWPIVVWDLWT